jgi:hypothetical protein
VPLVVRRAQRPPAEVRTRHGRVIPPDEERAGFEGRCPCLLTSPLSSPTRLPQVRAELGLSPEVRIAVLIYGGHRAELSVREDFLPPG